MVPANENNKRIELGIVYLHGFCQVVDSGIEVRTLYQRNPFVLAWRIMGLVVGIYRVVY